jgi:asparagine synthase (glutamine-hydrolysing)
MFNYSNSGFDGLNKNMYLDLKTYLPDDIFTKVDRASMMVSLEVREPLVDYRLVEHAFRIPSSYKIRGTNRKYLMKMMMKDILPKEILHKEKQGFTIPMKNWMRNELKDFVINKLSKDNLKEIGLFNQSYIDKVLQEHMSKRKDNQRHIWSLMSFVMWYENYIQKV